MKSSLHLPKAYLLLIILVILFLGAWQLQWDFVNLVDSMKQRPVMSAVIYVFALISSVVFLPLSSLPLLPLAASVWGIVIGGTLSALGWWLGALLAFLLTRCIGRPILQYFISLHKLDQWEKRIPTDVTFLGIVLIRMIFPVEIPSFALGLFKNLSFKIYALASLIGILPFAYVMVAMGGAVATGQWFLLLLLMSFVALSIFLLHHIWTRE